MSEQEQTTQESGDTVGGTALKALAGAAAGGAATYAVRKALVSRNGHDHSDREDDDTTESTFPSVDDSREEQQDVFDDDDAEDDDVGEDMDDEYPENSAEDDVEYEDDDSDEVTPGQSDGSSRRGGLRRLVTPARLESASQLMLPVAEQAAGSAGRYVGERAPETIRKQIIPRFIDAFEEAT